MKRLWIACGILAILFLATLGNAWYLKRVSVELIDLLAQAEAAAESKDWSSAIDLSKQAYEAWEARSPYLHITLRHADTDDICISFQEVLEFLQRQEDGEYSAANARLMTQLSLLYEAEGLTLENIL